VGDVNDACLSESPLKLLAAATEDAASGDLKLFGWAMGDSGGFCSFLLNNENRPDFARAGGFFSALKKSSCKHV